MRNQITNEVSKEEFIQSLKKKLEITSSPFERRRIEKRLEREKQWKDYKYNPDIVPFF